MTADLGFARSAISQPLRRLPLRTIVWLQLVGAFGALWTTSNPTFCFDGTLNMAKSAAGGQVIGNAGTFTAGGEPPLS
ncbi:MAG: hypothetical protein ACK4GT_13255 [Pararhodobacter sp.]